MLHNYYYFLGISPSATPQEITQAYRKLAVKFHPDKNGNDPYFQARFRDLQEAYDCLSDPQRRALYQQQYQKHLGQYQQQLPPSIKMFSAELKGSKILLKWQTNHADLVKIIPMGLVPAYGEMLCDIPTTDAPVLRLILHATNQVLQKTVLSSVNLQLSDIHQPEAQSDASANINPELEVQSKNPWFLVISLLVLALLFWLLWAS
jgi:curved DNA-binding protein CbpA